MEVSPGYKMTDVGVIPEEWAVESLGNVVTFSNGKPHEANVREDGSYSLITLDSIGIDGGLKPDHKRTDAWDNSLSKHDIVTVLSDLAHGNLLGLCDLIPEDNKYVLNQRMGRLRLKVAADPLFIRHQINRRQDHFRKRGQGTSQRNIYKRDFDSLDIPFAPEAEQHAIAVVLSDVDALLAGLGRLIAKKRDLKQAAMHQLLTGQTRLPGFQGQWESSPLRRFVSRFIVPMRDKPKHLRGDIPWCRIEDFDGMYLATSKSSQGVDADTVRAMNLKVYPEGTLLVSCSADLGRCAVVARPLVSNQTFIGLQMDDAVASNVFFYYLMTHKAGELNTLSSGTTISYLSREQFEEFVVFVPGEREEQTAIANILADMDAELLALEADRYKTRALKTAMMQELLNGRTRLVPAGAAIA